MKKVLILVLVGCAVASAWASDMYVAAAASLTDVMKTIKPLYEKRHPDTKLMLVYGSTGMLRAQVRKGAPCDVFIGADRWFGGAASNMAEVVKTDSVRVVAANSLVAVAGKDFVPKGNALAAWLDGTKKIGIGNPVSVPAGRYAKKLLESEKLWDVCAPKFVLGTNVREVLLWLRQGAVDVGFVYGSDLVAVKDPSLRMLAEYATPGGTAIELAGGVAKDAKDPAAALRFLEYLKSPEASKVFKDLGFASR